MLVVTSGGRNDDMNDHANTVVASRSRQFLKSIARRSGRTSALACLATAAVAIAGCSGGTGEPENSNSPLRVRLMTGKQYSTTLAYLFGSDISDAVPAPMPQLTRTDGLLAMGAASVGVTADQLQQLQQAATF